MKITITLSWMAMSILLAGISTSPLHAQDSAAVKNDSALIIPFPQLPVVNMKAIGNKKTGELVLSMDFQNNHDKVVEAMVRLGGWPTFGFITDKGTKYTLHTSYNRALEKNPHNAFKRIENIQFGNGKLDMVTVIPQDIPAGEKRTLLIRIPAFNKTASEIRDFRIGMIYSPDHFYKGDKTYFIRLIPIVWK